MPTVVILGAAYAGTRIAHTLLKKTRSSVKDLKVILVAKNTHFYWNIAAVRAIIPGLLKEEQYMLPIAKGFENYPSDAFEFIVGAAEGLDTDAKTVRVRVSASGEERQLAYDQLVLATGSRYVNSDMPWKADSTYEEIKSTLESVQQSVAEAKHIVVAGAGATGVEVAAELGFEYAKSGVAADKKKEVILLSGDLKLLNGDICGLAAANELKKLGVETRYSKRVESTAKLPDGKTEVTLANGEKIITDLYLPTMGVVPNSEYVPAALLNDRKFVEVDECYHATGAQNVWAAGDIVSKPKAGFVLADFQAAGVSKNIDAVLKGKTPSPVSLLPFDVMVAATGRQRGVIRFGNFKGFSFMAHMIKSKTLGMQNLPGTVSGSSF